MRSPLHLSTLVANLFLLIILAAIWILFAPTKIGGRASYVVVNGNSMEPGFHRGDLVIVQASSTYNVGDIVTYHNSQVNAFIIHRIIGIEQDHYIFKGDNNAWVDTYHPTREELIGKLWIHLPRLGNAMQWLRIPIHMGVTIGLLGGILMVSTILKPNRRGKQRNKSFGNSGGMLEGALYLLGTFSLVFLGLIIFAFIRPLTRPAEKIQYQQESQFAYTATGAPVIYDTGVARSGEPVFPKLTCFLNISFTYNVLGDQIQGVSGTQQLVARVLDEQSGWQRTIPMTERTVFSGNSFSTTSTLDLCQMISLVNLLKQETGLRANTYTLEIIPQIVMAANAQGNPISDSFEPKLVFKFDEVHFSLSAPKGQDDPLHDSKQSSVSNSKVETNTVSIFGTKTPVGSIRIIALLGFAFSLSGLLMIGIRLFAAAQQSEDALIRLRYGALLVNVYERDLEPASPLVDVTTIDELAKLAERHNTVILHMVLNFLHCYIVQSNGLTYRYVFSAGKSGIAEIESPRRPIINYVPEVNESRMIQVGSVEDELFGYTINRQRAATSEGTDAVLLKKIKL